tara:strand:+ start:65 stop:415 length:351 start_codon:yes stop_codon:yes gene_type:complete
MINNKKTNKKQLKHHGNPVMGGSGGIGFIGGAGVKAVTGAMGLVKNVLTRGAKSIKGKTTSLPNPLPKNTKAYNKLQYPMGKKAFSQTPKSKPVNFKGPNPAHNTGAGGNSYPSGR